MEGKLIKSPFICVILFVHEDASHPMAASFSFTQTYALGNCGRARTLRFYVSYSRRLPAIIVGHIT
jgi:hypothetical protein